MNSLEQVLKTNSQPFGQPDKGQETGVFKNYVQKPHVSSLYVGALEHRLSLGSTIRVRRLLLVLRATGLKSVIVKICRAYAIYFILIISLAWIMNSWFISRPGTSMAALALSNPSVDYLYISDEAGLGLVQEIKQSLEYNAPSAVESSAILARSSLLSRYLDERGSPLREYSSIIAAQPHWKLILAISFAESGLGKRCADNNCSGIGVAPGHPKWQTYETKGEWAKALNRLLEKRYKDWTLKQMNGVYNQPGSSNWLAATTQILGELEERQIE